MAISHRLKVKSQCDWGLGRLYLSLGEDLAKGFKRHLCFVRPPALIMAVSAHVNFLWFPTTYAIFTLEDSVFQMPSHLVRVWMCSKFNLEASHQERGACLLLQWDCNSSGSKVVLVPPDVTEVFANTLCSVQWTVLVASATHYIVYTPLAVWVTHLCFTTV